MSPKREARDQERRAWGAHRTRRPVAGALPYLTFFARAHRPRGKRSRPALPSLGGITRSTGGSHASGRRGRENAGAWPERSQEEETMRVGRYFVLGLLAF